MTPLHMQWEMKSGEGLWWGQPNTFCLWGDWQMENSWNMIHLDILTVSSMKETFLQMTRWKSCCESRISTSWTTQTICRVRGWWCVIWGVRRTQTAMLGLSIGTGLYFCCVGATYGNIIPTSFCSRSKDAMVQTLRVEDFARQSQKPNGVNYTAFSMCLAQNSI